MTKLQRVLLRLLGLALVVIAAAPHYHRSRPKMHCYLPERDYQYRDFSQPLRAVSRNPVPLRLTTSKAPSADLLQKPAISSFQFVKAPRLQIDHCSISRISVQLQSSGTWTVSLRADQNPVQTQVERKVTTQEPVRLFTDHLQRNQFYVTAFCYAGYGPGDENDLLGKPLVIPLEVKPFWVQKQQPYALFEVGYDKRVHDYFDVIDRVEIEFKYRK